MDINSCLQPIPAATLALYAHLIPAIATLILGVFGLIASSDKVKAGIFFAFTSTFAAWLLLDLTNWVSHDFALVAATWAPLDFVNIVFFLLLGCFIFADLYPKGLPTWFSSMVLVAAIVPFGITVMGQAVYEMDLANCEMIGNDFLATYKLVIEGLVLFAAFALALWRIVLMRVSREEWQRVTIVVGSVILFMGVFAGIERYSTFTGNYEATLYSLFALPVFVLFLTIAITSYGTMRLGDSGVKALFYVFLVLAGTQFFFVSDMSDFLLALMSFVVVLTLGIMLYRTSEREIQQRHVIETQAHELETVNRQQENLLHFISHEVKGYLGKGEAAFAGIVQGDYGKTTQKLASMAKAGLEDARRGVDMVSDILDASNLRKGTMSYAQTVFDLKESVERVIETLMPVAEAHGLSLTTNITEGDYSIKGDEAKFRRHVVRNLIDNAIRYTPSGSITVSLTSGKNVTFAVTDTGVGITAEDKENLFTEGGHGKESLKVNVDSTGYGLYIAKQVAEAHGGSIRAESKGKGKGSTFTVEVPHA